MTGASVLRGLVYLLGYTAGRFHGWRLRRRRSRFAEALHVVAAKYDGFGRAEDAAELRLIAKWVEASGSRYFGR